MNLSTATGQQRSAGLSRLQGWWQQRARREQAMLLTMLLAITGFVAWYGLLAPLLRWQAQGQQQLEQARRQQQQLHSSLQALEQQVQPPEVLLQQWQASLADSGLQLAQHSSDAGQGPSMETAPGKAQALTGWLAQLPAAQLPDQLQLWRGNGSLQARLQRQPVGSHATPPSQK